MKTNIKALFLAAISPIALVGCNSKYSLSGQSEVLNPSYYDSNFKKACKDLMGEVVPFLPCVTYSYNFSKDSYGDPFMELYFTYNLEETMDKAYDYFAYLCQEDEYEVESSYYVMQDSYILCYYADKVVGKQQGLELIIMEAMPNGVPTVGVFGVPYVYEDPAVYPQVAVEKLLGKDLAKKVPQIKGSGYEYAFKFSNEITDEYNYQQLRIGVYNAPITVEEDYFNALQANGFIMLNDLSEQVLEEYPGLFESSYDAYYYEGKNFKFGIYFTYSMYSTQTVFLIDIWTIEYYK